MSETHYRPSELRCCGTCRRLWSYDLGPGGQCDQPENRVVGAHGQKFAPTVSAVYVCDLWESAPSPGVGL